MQGQHSWYSRGCLVRPVSSFSHWVAFCFFFPTLLWLEFVAFHHFSSHGVELGFLFLYSISIVSIISPT
jgi:hypothetical protein